MAASSTANHEHCPNLSTKISAVYRAMMLSLSTANLRLKHLVTKHLVLTTRHAGLVTRLTRRMTITVDPQRAPSLQTALEKTKMATSLSTNLRNEVREFRNYSRPFEI